MSEVPYDRELLVKVLIYHPACDVDGGCHCGWGEWGQSHAEHVAAAYETAALARTGQELPAPATGHEDNHRIALARELTAMAGCPLRDRYGFTASNESALRVINFVFQHPSDRDAAEAIGLANALGDVELADGYDTPIDEQYELRIVEALRPMVEQRRNAAARGPLTLIDRPQPPIPTAERTVIRHKQTGVIYVRTFDDGRWAKWGMDGKDADWTPTRDEFDVLVPEVLP